MIFFGLCVPGDLRSLQELEAHVPPAGMFGGETAKREFVDITNLYNDDT